MRRSFPRGARWPPPPRIVRHLTLGALIGHFAERRLIRLYVLGVAILLTVMIGLSRIYLGLHWTTDVLGGWCVGAAWALGWRAVVQCWRRFGLTRSSD